MAELLEDTVHNEKSARLDARGVAKLYDVTLVDIAKAIGKNEDTVRKNPDSHPIQENLGILVDCFARVYDSCSTMSAPSGAGCTDRTEALMVSGRSRYSKVGAWPNCAQRFGRWRRRATPERAVR